MSNLTLKTQHLKPPSHILGVHLEGPFLNTARCGALDPGSFIRPAIKQFEELIDSFGDMVKIITIAPELEGSLKLIKQAREMGINISMGHSDATFAEAEAGYQKGAQGITHLFNAMRAMHHREPGIAGFGLLNNDVFVEVIVDPYHLHPGIIELIFRTKNPDKIIIVSDSIKESPGRAQECSGVRHLESKGKNQNIGIRNSELNTTSASRTCILQGGSTTIAESADRLIKMGYRKRMIKNCIKINPASYLKNIS